ncbi:DUF6527 family protein [Terriglobus saanensis]|uniref:Uncharacterized protein n=1 Tax=Terriglobus saanensis (strain ATCC BAA-1853 / DSM 23119 / SP1PR4) TaxID=401053 RepID=E8V189_TERSS|nr:hypothetical protein AciPR4_3755 [Terriglobus saanensis SP1PR4]
MISHKYLKHHFVEHIPEQLELGLLYISIPYATAAHSCCCGCGEEVVTPFTPTDWRMTFDGDTVSLKPSIGNWSLPCRSHYVISRGSVIEALPWTKDEIRGEHHRDKTAKKEFYEHRVYEPVPPHVQSPRLSEAVKPSLWVQAWRWIRERG